MILVLYALVLGWVMLFLGIFVLIRGEIAWTPSRRLRGLPAKAFGILLILPAPFGMLTRAAAVPLEGRPHDPSVVTTRQADAMTVGTIATLVSLGLVIVIALLYAKPKNQAEPAPTAPEPPAEPNSLGLPQFPGQGSDAWDREK